MAKTRRRPFPSVTHLMETGELSIAWHEKIENPAYGARGNARGKSNSGSKGQSDNGGKPKP